MKFKKFITIMQAASGVVPLNKRELLPPGRKLWRPPGDQPGYEHSRSDLLTSSRSRYSWTREAQYRDLYLRHLSSSRSYSALTIAVQINWCPRSSPCQRVSCPPGNRLHIPFPSPGPKDINRRFSGGYVHFIS
ncbi:hypothetical protein NHX12_027539 [Muraenolepis orangiensis]|uniref:Uncharacterized protein n=1 Tax=Muraenolepis orangiensis TaxID=630683 RepID=A0A9Q0EH59_9TELE|nr:hypothetical protein NHX12_027539 [Muraenolepis orangiensis]